MSLQAGHIKLGQKGEDEAARHLTRLGWKIVSRNWRPGGSSKALELDIVAHDGATLVFVEVKTRSTKQSGKALSVPVHTALTAQKKARVARAAGLYLSATETWDKPCRFDLICIEEDKHGTPSLEHYRNVIELGHIVDRGHTAWQPW